MLIDHVFVDVVLPVEAFAERALNLFRLLRVIPPFLIQSHHPVEAVKVIKVIVLHWCEVACILLPIEAVTFKGPGLFFNFLQRGQMERRHQGSIFLGLLFSQLKFSSLFCFSFLPGLSYISIDDEWSVILILVLIRQGRTKT